MLGNKLKSSLLALFLIAPLSVAGATEEEQLNDIYRQFFASTVDTDAIAERYGEDIIHVGRNGAPLVAGKAAFMSTNILPLAEMVNTGQMTFDGTVYVLRRVVSGDIANDVGYLHSVITVPGKEPIEQLQKFSWVFLKENNTWRVITDFDATTAPLEVLDEIEAQIVID